MLLRIADRRRNDALQRVFDTNDTNWVTGDIMPKQGGRIVAKLDLRGGFRLREQTNERARRISMLTTCLRLATVTAVFVAWIATPASAQSVHATAPLAAQASRCSTTCLV